MSERAPYISLVATTRNDGHGGNIMKRMRMFVKGLIVQANQFKLPLELIIVEWNPPQDKPLLKEVLPLPTEDDFLSVRFILVPEELHAQYRRSDVIPLFQMTAKNVGIKRALSDWILCTNIDLIFSDELFEELAKRNLKKDHFYRANRVDFPEAVEEEWPLEKQLDYAKNNVVRRLGKDYKYLNLTKAPEIVYQYRFLAWALDRLTTFKKWLLEEPANTAFNRLDTNACGDFTMMHRDAWERINGYLELDMYSIHIDSFAILGAVSAGYKQYIFDPRACTYHVDHPSGWESMSPVEKIKFCQVRPGIGFEVLWESASYMLDSKLEFDINPETWGFSDKDLTEYHFGRRWNTSTTKKQLVNGE